MGSSYRQPLRTHAERTASSGPCGTCRFFDDDPKTLEKTLTGLTVFSSAYGSACGGAGLCSVHDLFLHPRQSCPDYQATESVDARLAPANR